MITRSILITTVFLLMIALPAAAQQSGGIRIMEAAPEGSCKDETMSDEASGKRLRRQTELAKELAAMLKRTAEIQKKLSAGAGKDLQAELSRMIERAAKMTAELEGMAGGKNP